MPQIPDTVRRHSLLFLVMAGILYGSLYPFEFHLHDAGRAGLSHLLGTWRDPPTSRGDLIVNILLYMPLGFAAAYGSAGNSWRVGAGAVGIGAALSFSIEWVQFYDLSRVSCLSDFYLNVIGSMAGVLISQMRAFRLPVIALPEGRSALFARVLLFAWAGWRLYPYVPAIDLHQYWNSLKPVLFHPDISAYGVFRFAVLWTAVSQLLRLGVQPKLPLWLMLSIMAAYFCGKVMIIGQALNPSELIGAAIAVVLSRLPQARSYSVILMLLFAAIVILSRVMPWHVTGTIRPFQWVPFYSLLHGSLVVDVLALCEKTFLYGTLLVLMVEVGLPLIVACAGECIILLGTSALETLLADRSAEVTDAIIAFLLTLAYLILGRQSRHFDGGRRGEKEVHAPGMPANRAG